MHPHYSTGWALGLFLLIVFGVNRPASAMMNCLLAHELCTKDASCTSVKTVIRHICGPETVACSTTTVTKCQAGLRTLQAFPYFHPTCLCREPSVDPHCNAFRDFLFDHPCMVAAQREADPYPIHALPTCTHALDVCRKDQSCVRMYEEFREQCKQKDGTCRDREACHVAWRNLRMTPVFGCFCPSTQHKKCERLYAFIYNNTCVGVLLEGRLHASRVVRRHAKSLVPPASPSSSRVLFPSAPPTTTTPGTATTSADETSDESNGSIEHGTDHVTNSTTTTTSTDATPTSTMSTAMAMHYHGTGTSTPVRSDHDGDDAGAGNTALVHQQQQQNETELIESRLVVSRSAAESAIDVSETSHFVHSAFMNTRIIGPAQQPNASSESPAASNGIGGHASPEEATMTTLAAPSSRVYLIYQSTCQRAMASCQSNGACRRHLEPMMRYCNGLQHANQPPSRAIETCHRDLCMQAVQGFYKDAPLNLTLEVAFCVCKKSTNRNDECLIAQERLHPDCARRPERYSSGGGAVVGLADGSLTIPACHQLAEECKNHPDCKPRLEFYVQACAVDTVTKGCAGLPSICRRAVLDILGTDLRTSCNCKATQQHADVAAMYDCLEWQRLLWLNPCVVEAQRDYHKSQGNLKVVTVPGDASTSSSSAPSSTGTTTAWWTTRQTTSPWYSSAEIDSMTHPMTTGRTHRPSSTHYARGDAETIAPSVNRFTSTSASPGTTETTARPTTPAKMCTLERPGTGAIYFPEGTSKRLYQDDDPDCSELCRCDAGQRVTCAIVSCAERKPCQTSVAVYAHASTAFQAYRGECLCFSGAFVCAKPDPGHYSLPSGIYLFIGYSRADERAIYQITYQNVSRFLFSSIRRLMESKRDPESECRISVHDQIEENVIFRIELATFDDHRLNNSVTLEMLTQEKAQCLPLANELKRSINKGLPETKEDGILSIIKVADVAALMPEPRRSSAKSDQREFHSTVLVSLVALICVSVLS